MYASVISFFTADIIANGVFTAQKTCQEWGGGGARGSGADWTVDRITRRHRSIPQINKHGKVAASSQTSK